MKKLLLLFAVVTFVSCSNDTSQQDPKLSCNEIKTVYTQKLKDLLKYQSTMSKELFNQYYNEYTTEREKLLKENGCN